VTTQTSSVETTTLIPRRAFCVFVFAGAAIVVLEFLILGLWEVIWTDLVRHNPHRSLAHALSTMPVMFVVVGAWIVVSRLSGALLFAGSVAATSAKILGRVPLWLAVLLVPLCGLVIHFQEIVWPSLRWYTDDPDNQAGPLAVTLRMAAYLIPGIIGPWWLLRRDRSGPQAFRPTDMAS
jgi:hypothetical protein